MARSEYPCLRACLASVVPVLRRCLRAFSASATCRRNWAKRSSRSLMVDKRTRREYNGWITIQRVSKEES